MQVVNICVDVLTEEQEDGGKRLKEGLDQVSSGKVFPILFPSVPLLVYNQSDQLCQSNIKRGMIPTLTSCYRRI